ncbi:Serine/threonine-protein phosphatase 6 regulatory subunit 1 [Varanus komodoensis]|nr:Serine/threonine-protein phosphatase 6 regulatory subunit 1 [Varanus komodoensis]
MFWKFDLHTTSHIDTLLERGNVTLFELLDEEDVLQECKVVNRKLVDFLVQPEHMEALVTCVTEEPPGDVDERVRYKYPSVSCEILTSDITQINDALGEDESLLRRLYSFLQTGGILNPLLASFFSKVMGILINRKTDQIVAFLRKKDDFVNLLLRHIGTSAIMDLLLRLLTCVEQPQLRQDVFNWLNEEKIVQRLIGMIHPSKDDNQHSNASQSLCDIIRLSREQMIQIQDSPEPDQLLATLEKQETIEQLLSNMLDGEQSESVIVNGIQVLLTLLEPRRPRTELGGMGGFYCNLEGQMEMTGPNCEVASSQASLGTLLAIKQRLRELHRLLLDPPKKEALQTTWGILDPPLGNTRLHVVKLLASSLGTNNAALLDEIIELGALDTMLLFFNKMFRPQKDMPMKLIQLHSSVLQSLIWWTVPVNLNIGVLFQPRCPVVTLGTDASLLGWGALCSGLRTQGVWNRQESMNHINVLELLAVSKALRSFEDILWHQVVQIASDNIATVFYLNKQGGTKSLTLARLLMQIWSWRIPRDIALVVVHLAGTDNVEADLLSRQMSTSHEWELDRHICDQLFHRWGHPNMDLFATWQNRTSVLDKTVPLAEPFFQLFFIDDTSPPPVRDLYFKYTYNNFLHAQVEACLSSVFSSHTGDETIENHSEPLPENPVIQHLLQRCRLIQRILSAWEENEQSQLDGGRRKGYMGHLTRIANALAQGSEKWPHSTLIKQLLKELPEEEQEQWDKFVSGPLSETNKKNTVDLVNMHNLHSSSDDDENDLKEFSFPQEAVLQQAFVDYQLQQMTSAFIEHFGFNDEEFGEQEENVNAPFDKTANITFSLNADDDSPNSNLFDICYKERIQQFDDEEEADGSDGEDIWQEKEATASSGTAQSTAVRSLGSTDSEESEDSEEGEGGEEEDPGGGDRDATRVSNGCGEQTEEEERMSGDSSWADNPSDLSSVSLVSSESVAADTGAAVWDQSSSDGCCLTTDENWASFTESQTQQDSPSKALVGPASPANLPQEVTQSNVSLAGASSIQQDPPTPDTGPPEGCDPPNPSTMTTVASTVEPPPSTSDSTQPLQGTTEAPQPECSSPQTEQQQQHQPPVASKALNIWLFPLSSDKASVDLITGEGPWLLAQSSPFCQGLTPVLPVPSPLWAGQGERIEQAPPTKSALPASTDLPHLSSSPLPVPAASASKFVHREEGTNLSKSLIGSPVSFLQIYESPVWWE